MREYITSFFDEYDYPEEARRALMSCYEMTREKDSEGILDKYISQYERDELSSYGEPLEALTCLAKNTGINEYELHLLFFICLSRHLRERYEKAGIAQEIYHNSILDLKWKLIECYKLYGIYGSFVARWFHGFFNMTRFAIGRLQYEIITFKKEYKNGENELHTGDKVINVHIPSSGHLNHDDCMASYRAAAEFFREQLDGKPVAFYCYSWLLFPFNREILSPKSNIIAFMNDYDIFDFVYNEGYDELWRFFYKKYDGNPDNMPSELSMQRGYLKWIKAGNKIGCGIGVYFFK